MNREFNDLKMHSTTSKKLTCDARSLQMFGALLFIYLSVMRCLSKIQITVYCLMTFETEAISEID